MNCQVLNCSLGWGIWEGMVFSAASVSCNSCHIRDLDLKHLSHRHTERETHIHTDRHTDTDVHASLDTNTSSAEPATTC